MRNFEELGVRADIVKGLTEMNISSPSDIQKKVIPLLLEEPTDLIGQAQTGTGKTAAFGLPLLQRIDPQLEQIQGLILCPTRELGKQVGKQLFKFTKYSERIFIEVVCGGDPIDRQIASLQRPTHIVVATPGRLIELVSKKVIDLRNVQTVVLDEADEMLSLGFKKELDEILGFMREVQEKWLFSATMPDGIKDLVNKHMAPDAKRITVNRNEVVNKKIRHEYLICEDDDKFFILQQFLKSEHKNRGVIFCRTKAATQKLTKQLIAKNIEADAIHGDLTQKERDKVMRAFKGDKLRLLVATDLAARGIDVSELSFVVHYQLPESDEYYTHRSGRTARAGNEGLSICFVNSKEVRKLRNYERTLGIGFKEIKKAR